METVQNFIVQEAMGMRYKRSTPKKGRCAACRPTSTLQHNKSVHFVLQH